MQPETYYELLEVEPSAPVERIEAAYKRIRSYLQPDSLALYSMLDEDEARELMNRVEVAYRTLSDSDRREAYDRYTAGEVSEAPRVVLPEPTPPPKAAAAVEHKASPASESAPSERADEPDRSQDWVGSGVEPPTMSVVDPSEVGRPLTVSMSKPRKLKPDLSLFELTDETEYTGSLLRRIRESAGADIEAIADITKIGRHYLTAIEATDFETLPAAVYTRGFVTEYARILGLDGRRVSQSYMGLLDRFRDENTET